MTGPSDSDAVTPPGGATQAQHETTVRLLHNQIQQLILGTESYQARIEQLVSENRALSRQSAGLQAVQDELAGLYDRADAMTAQIARLEAQLAARDADLARLQGEIETIRASASYRLGAPLRAFRGRRQDD